jgi:uncharacterized membrane protein
MRWLQIRIEMRTLHVGNHAKAAREHGQTIALVAVAMVGVLAMAALAIDLTTLYVAHGEIQRAADAAALAGAKAFADSGVTTNPTNAALQGLAQTMAGDFAAGVLPQNNVAGSPAHFINGTPLVNLNIIAPGNPNAPGNPRITVTLQQTSLGSYSTLTTATLTIGAHKLTAEIAVTPAQRQPVARAAKNRPRRQPR